jgi:S-adenosylmethionine hydrolase
MKIRIKTIINHMTAKQLFELYNHFKDFDIPGNDIEAKEIIAFIEFLEKNYGNIIQNIKKDEEKALEEVSKKIGTYNYENLYNKEKLKEEIRNHSADAIKKYLSKIQGKTS